MWLLEPDTAYTFPNDDGVTLLTCLPARQKLPAFKKDLEGSFERFFEGLPEGPRLAGAERVSKVMGATNLVNRSRPASVDGLAFVGDAALWSDPLWGIGCGWAFQSAEWLADETASAPRDRRQPPRGARPLPRQAQEEALRAPAHHLRLLRGGFLQSHREADVLGSGKGRTVRQALPRLRLPARRGARVPRSEGGRPRPVRQRAARRRTS